MNNTPCMQEGEIQKIRSHLLPSHTMLEWGAGGSTIFFSRLVKVYFSIEHDPAWYGQVRDALSRAGLKNVRLFLVKQNSERTGPSKYEQFRDYVDSIRTLVVKSFDRVLIDGRARPECAKALLPFVDRNSIVFFHDFYLPGREYYRKALDHYVEIDSIKTGPQTLAILRKKA